MFEYLLQDFSDETILTACLQFLAMGFGVALMVSLVVWLVFYALLFFKRITRS